MIAFYWLYPIEYTPKDIPTEALAEMGMSFGVYSIAVKIHCTAGFYIQ